MCAKAVTVAASALLLATACAGEEPTAIVLASQPSVPPRKESVAALSDAEERIVPTLEARCRQEVERGLRTLRARMAPPGLGGIGDVRRVRIALRLCRDDATAPEREAIRLALNATEEIIAARPDLRD